MINVQKTIDLQLDDPWRIEIGENNTCAIHVVCSNMDSGVLTVRKSNIPDKDDLGVDLAGSPVTISAQGYSDLDSTTDWHLARYLVFAVTTNSSGAALATVYVTLKHLAYEV